MWPDITPLLQQLKAECSDKSWLVTGCQLDCPLASVGLGDTRLQRLESSLLLNSPFTERFAVALMLINDTDDTHTAEFTIGRLRDVLAERVLVLVPEHSTTWDVAKMLGFGFKRIAELKGWQAWGFDIHTYKEVPDWLNAKFWANPQNWGKYWW
jgi:hypothetical protein